MAPPPGALRQVPKDNCSLRERDKTGLREIETKSCGSHSKQQVTLKMLKANIPVSWRPADSFLQLRYRPFQVLHCRTGDGGGRLTGLAARRWHVQCLENKPRVLLLGTVVSARH